MDLNGNRIRALLEIVGPYTKLEEPVFFAPANGEHRGSAFVHYSAGHVAAINLYVVEVDNRAVIPQQSQREVIEEARLRDDERVAEVSRVMGRDVLLVITVASSPPP